MDNAGYIAYARAALLERATDVSANNIANSNTAGFKAQQALFEDLVAKIPGNGEASSISYAIDKATITDITAGSVERTGNPLDVAVTGDSWLAYLTAQGRIVLGRDGGLVLSADGDLMTASGDRILDIGGAPVNVPPGSSDLTIAQDGTITGGDGEVIAQIGVFDAPDIASWEHVRGSMMAPRAGEVDLVPAIEPGLMQGHIEGSNVNAITEMSRMISLQRSYERSMTMATTADDLRKQTLSRLGRS